MKAKQVLFFTILAYNSVSGMIATMIMPSADRMLRFATVGGDGIMVALAILALYPHRRFYGVQLFLLLLLVSTLTMIYNIDRFGFPEHLNGLRETLYFFSSLIVVNDLYQSHLRASFARAFTIFLIAYAIAQLPVTTYQFLKYGASDNVGGTYGIGGGSGYISMLAFLITFYLGVRYATDEDGENFRVSRMLLVVPLLIPCALNETKVSFVLLAVFLLLIAIGRRRFYKAIPFLLLGAGLMYLLNYYYSESVEDTRNIFDEQYIERYLLTDNVEAGVDLPRFQRLVIMFRMMAGDIGSILLGMGYGVVGGGNVMGVSRLGRTLYFLMTGSRILLFRTWIQGGLLGVLLVAGAVYGWLRSKVEQYHTLHQFSLFLMFVLTLVWFYNEATFDRVFAPIVCFFMVWIAGGGRPFEEETAEESGEEETEAHA